MHSSPSYLNRWPLLLVFLALIGENASHPVMAGPLTVAARESAEAVVRQWGEKAVAEGVEKFAIRLESLATKYGDDALSAARKVGPRGVSAIEAAGERAPLVAQLLTREGDRALWLVDDAARLQLVAKYGDDATAALLRHQGIAQPLISQFDNVAAKALTQLDPQNARRLAMLADDGSLAAMGRTPELLGVVAKYGDRAMDFIWKNKAALATTAALVAFLNSPEEFLDGTKKLAEVVGESVIVPTTTAIAKEIAPHVNWTLVTLGGLAIVAVYWLGRQYLWQKLTVR
ncbi:MAG: hypothetical protein JNM18_19840 [Planctomycetaceae bacterium]|nr:hypothetical protein [Planctomycetaceae bacterium]